MDVPIGARTARVIRQHAFKISLSTAILFLLAPRAQGSTWYVGNNGVDGPGCGAQATPCRSISGAIDQPTTVAGDRIIVGPGRYGDLNENGVLGEPGEETPAPGCGCMLAVNKGIILTSSHGAAVTVIDARSVSSATNVLLIMQNGEFGRPGKGLTVTQTSAMGGTAIAIDSQNIAVRGNQVLHTNSPPDFSGVGISSTIAGPQTILIEGNQVMGWVYGIVALGPGRTVRKNVAFRNSVGIGGRDGEFVSNVAVDNADGFAVSGTATFVGNAAYGNAYVGVYFGGGSVPFTGLAEKNNVSGNGIHSLADPNCGVTNDAPGLVAINNYWGSASGPGADPADDVCGDQAATVVPFATEPFKVRAPIKP